MKLYACYTLFAPIKALQGYINLAVLLNKSTFSSNHFICVQLTNMYTFYVFLIIAFKCFLRFGIKLVSLINVSEDIIAM